MRSACVIALALILGCDGGTAGPQGEAGPRGPAGPEGAQGPAGPTASVAAPDIGPGELGPGVTIPGARVTGSVSAAGQAATAADASMLGGRSPTEYLLAADAAAAYQPMGSYATDADVVALCYSKTAADARFAVQGAPASRFLAAASPPVTCDAAGGGAAYFDATLRQLRYCDGTGWASAGSPSDVAILSADNAFTGTVSVPAPTAASHAAPKIYVDAALANAATTADVDALATEISSLTGRVTSLEAGKLTAQASVAPGAGLTVPAGTLDCVATAWRLNGSSWESVTGNPSFPMANDGAVVALLNGTGSAQSLRLVVLR